MAPSLPKCRVCPTATAPDHSRGRLMGLYAPAARPTPPRAASPAPGGSAHQRLEPYVLRIGRYGHRSSLSIEGRLPRPCPGSTTSCPSRNLCSLVLGDRWVVTCLDRRLPRRLAPSIRWVLGDWCGSPVIYANVRN